ncbi:MAG: signal recognition particle-docking protein FtsY [Myxococcota bacterium]|nr:signal recognition particle-docking protein FtsY [Myxococcota bacterium]
MAEPQFAVWLIAHPGVIAAVVTALSLAGFGIARALETQQISEVAAPEDGAAEESKPVARIQVVAEAPEPSLVAAALEPAQEAPPVERKSEPASLRERLSRTSGAFVGRLGSMLGGRSVDDELLEDLEGLLFTADLGVQTAESLMESVRSKAKGQDASAVREVLRSAVGEKLQRVQPQGDPLATEGSPHVILVLGVNGSGKTTTIGKLAARYSNSGKTVVLGAGDTFRAAATEQLQVWGERVGCEVVAGQAGGDPASVAFDTVKAAIARKVDVAIIDTAGRLQTKKPLMEELAKINRVLSRDLPDAPHEVLLVLDSNTGQNAISQAELFAEVADLTGLVLTKLDGTAKGGVIVGLADRFGIPVKYVGVGEGVEDLRDFEAEEFVAALFAEGDAND